MLDLNNVPEDNNSGDFELIPVGTVVRAVIKLKGGTTELPERSVPEPVTEASSRSPPAGTFQS